MDINWEKIEASPEPFSIFRPTFDDNDKTMDLYRKLLNTPLYLSDEYRTEQMAFNLLQYYFSGINLFYEIGSWGGVFGLVNIRLPWKATMVVKLWDSSLWSKTLLKNGRQLLKTIMKELNLKKIESSTPDEKMTKVYKMAGFELEGIRKLSFCWDGVYYDDYLFGLMED
jgi:RimJ/RimL family protein N-acetyltransferase